MYEYVFMYVCMYICSYVYVRTYSYMHIISHTYTYIPTYIRPCVHSYMHVCVMTVAFYHSQLGDWGFGAGVYSCSPLKIYNLHQNLKGRNFSIHPFLRSPLTRSAVNAAECDFVATKLPSVPSKWIHACAHV